MGARDHRVWGIGGEEAILLPWRVTSLVHQILLVYLPQDLDRCVVLPVLEVEGGWIHSSLHLWEGGLARDNPDKAVVAMAGQLSLQHLDPMLVTRE